MEIYTVARVKAVIAAAASVTRVTKSRRKTKKQLTLIYREIHVNIHVDKRFNFYIQ